MNISALHRYASKVLYGSGESWDFLFYQAVNSVIRDLRSYTVVDIDEIDEVDPPNEIDTPSQYSGIFYQGVPYYMQRSPIWAKREGGLVEIDYMKVLGQVQADALDADPPAMGFDYDDDV